MVEGHGVETCPVVEEVQENTLGSQDSGRTAPIQNRLCQPRQNLWNYFPDKGCPGSQWHSCSGGRRWHFVSVGTRCGTAAHAVGQPLPRSIGVPHVGSAADRPHPVCSILPDPDYIPQDCLFSHYRSKKRLDILRLTATQMSGYLARTDISRGSSNTSALHLPEATTGDLVIGCQSLALRSTQSYCHYHVNCDKRCLDYGSLRPTVEH